VSPIVIGAFLLPFKVFGKTLSPIGTSATLVPSFMNKMQFQKKGGNSHKLRTVKKKRSMEDNKKNDKLKRALQLTLPTQEGDKLIRPIGDIRSV
jgi:hypothetical protein